MMGPEDIVTIGATVSLLTQVVKRSIPKDGQGPHIVALLSFVAVMMWVASSPLFPPDRTMLWSVFTGWVSIWATASGIYHGANVATTKAARIRAAGG
jgi:hypothetical protein